MKSLEFEGIYDLVIPGRKMPECKQLPEIYSSAPRLLHMISALVATVARLLVHVLSALLYGAFVGVGNVESQAPQTNQQVAERIRMFNHEWRAKNSHCFYFGIYSFNLTRWKTLDASHLRTWCNSTAHGQPGERRYLIGYVRHSNLIMLVVEDEFELYHCGNMSQFIKAR